MDVKLLTHNLPLKELKVNFTSGNDATNEQVLAENVVIYSTTVPGSQASRKIFARDLTRYDWEQKYHNGNLVTSNSEFFAYALRGLQTNFCIRIMNRSTGSKTLIKNFVHNICDLAFASHSNVVLGAVDVMGNFSIWELKSKGGSTLDFTILWSVKSGETVSSDNHRLKWQPTMGPPSCEGDYTDKEMQEPPPLFVVTSDKTVNVFDLDMLSNKFEEQRELNLKDISDSYISIKDHGGVVTDCDVSPDAQILATVSEDGCMKCFQLLFDKTPPTSKCLQNFQPHAKHSKLSSLLFCDNHRDPYVSESFWRFFVTGADFNREIKLWCASTWKLLQTITFDRDPQPMLKAAMDPTGRYVVLTDVMREIMYILTLKKHQNKDKSGYAVFFVCTEYVLSSPVLSFSIWQIQTDEEEEDEHERGASLNEVVIKMTSINTKTMQELEVRVSSDVFNPQKHLTPKGLAAAIPIKPQILPVPTKEQSTSGTVDSSVNGNMAGATVEEDEDEENDAAFSDADSINEELNSASKLTKLPVLATDEEPTTLDLEVECVEIEEDEDNDVDDEDDNDDSDMLLGPNSFGAAPEKPHVVPAVTDKKPVAASSKTPATNSSLNYAGFDSWDDDPTSSLTNVTRSPTLMPGFTNSASIDPSTPQPNSNNLEINDSVMKLFQSTTPRPSERQQSKNDADADALKALIGLVGPSTTAETSKKSAQSNSLLSSNQVVNPVSAGDTQPLINITGSAPQENSTVPQIDLTEVLTALKTIQENQAQLEKRLDKLTASVTANQKEAKTVTKDAIAAHVKLEIQQQVVPMVKKVVHPIINDMNNMVSQKLTSTDAVMKEQVKKIVSSKQISDQIGKQAATCVETAVSNKCRELFEQKLAPQFNRAIEESVKQVGHVFQSGTSEYLRALEAHGKQQSDHSQKHLDSHVNAVQKQMGSNQGEIQRIVKETVKAELSSVRVELQQSVSGMGKQIGAEVQTVLAEHNRQLHNTLQGQLKMMQRQVAAATPLPEGTQQNHVDVRPMVEEELKKQNFDKAFEIALTAADVPLVLHVCETVGSNLEKPTFKISIPNVLALLQQLSCNLQSCNRVELRLYVLEASLMKLDPIELCKYPKFDRSLSALERELTKFHQAKGRSDPCYGKAKMLASAVRELSAETKQLGAAQ
ncbi:enhancer of mRNA-decapping protein 4-like isoform X2 [Convolutriloba macropyga]|uniref:enhancer of mRNA-decapping protein 4-like isoform X2 n=1 Tax=Convolutriloba macropyga TaxID=536237 RepID=UPI003F523757